MTRSAGWELARWTAMQARRKRGTVVVDSSRVRTSVTAKDGAVTECVAAWAAITRVVAYKRDLLSCDLICLAFEAGEVTLDADEEMEGWADLLEALPTHFKGIRPQQEWWMTVAFPPFARNATQLYPMTDR